MRIESGRDQRGDVGGLADAGSVAADEGATGPATWLSRHRRKACETCGLHRFEAAELGISMSKAKAVMADRPGMLVKIANRWARSGSA